MFSLRRRDFVCLAAASVLAFAGAESARADTTVPITGIGTEVHDTFDINTHVDSVTFTTPQVVEIPGYGEAMEIRGTVAGVGWGGGGIVSRAQNAHYNYQIPFGARWRANGESKDVVTHYHGGGLNLIAAVQRDILLGPQNPDRWTELTCDVSVGVPALLNKCAYIAMNRRGLRGDGTFSATYRTSEISPLTQAEVSALNAVFATIPGGLGYGHPGIVVGAPVPLVPTSDTATFRDVSRALQQVVGNIVGRPFRKRIFSGQSSGARLGATMNFGRSPIGALSVRTGGNQVTPYDTTSARLFDGFILQGFPYETEAARVDSGLPLSAPVFFIQGRSDERYQHPIRIASELLENGVSLNGSVWIYEIKGLTHITRDQIYDTVAPSNGDSRACFLSAAISNMRDLLKDGLEPPRSWIAGRIHEGVLVFDVAGGYWSSLAPVLEDIELDSRQLDAFLVLRTMRTPETSRWLSVTAALYHEPDAITPPTIACRLGGYRIKFAGAELISPYSPDTLSALYGKFKGYRTRLKEVIERLKVARLYDTRVESANETAELSRALFAR